MSVEQQLQGLLDEMQADSDRIFATVSGMGDVVVRYKNNQKALFSELGRLIQHLANPQQGQPLYPTPHAVQGQPTGYTERGVPYYAQQQSVAPSYQQPYQQPTGVANGYDPGYYPIPQGYPPQPYQETGQPTDGPISQVLKNLRRQG